MAVAHEYTPATGGKGWASPPGAPLRLSRPSLTDRPGPPPSLLPSGQFIRHRIHLHSHCPTHHPISHSEDASRRPPFTPPPTPAIPSPRGSFETTRATSPPCLMRSSASWSSEYIPEPPQRARHRPAAQPHLARALLPGTPGLTAPAGSLLFALQMPARITSSEKPSLVSDVRCPGRSGTPTARLLLAGFPSSRTAPPGLLTGPQPSTEAGSRTVGG